MKFSIIYEAQMIDTSRANEAQVFQDMVDQCVLADDRFTLVSLDNYTGDYIEVKLWGATGRELASESLYEEE